MRRIPYLAALTIGLALPAAAETADSLLRYQGGGFVFNYRLGEAFYGIVVKPQRALPAGARIEADFENPAGGAPVRVEKVHSGSPKPISLRSPPVQGVKAETDYAVVIRLRDPQDGRLLGELRKTFRSNVDQSVLPSGPVTIGPGYHRNPRRE